MSGGRHQPHRDLVVITTLVPWIRSCGRNLAMLVCVDGLASDVTAFLHVFRDLVHTGRRGLPRLVLEEGLLLGQVAKRYVKQRVASVAHRVVRGTEAVLSAGMWLVGCAYNFCWLHESLRQGAPAGAPWKWQESTPAMAAGLTCHRWTMRELLSYQVPLPVLVAPKCRGRPPKRALQPVITVAT